MVAAEIRYATQKRFCATFIDRATKQAARAIPIYAEVRISVETAGTLTLAIRERDYVAKLLSHQEKVKAGDIVNSFEGHMNGLQYSFSYNDYVTILWRFTELVVDYLNHGSPTDENLAELIEKAIGELERSGKIARSSHETMPLSYRRPFGFLSTDHVGFVSFDIEDFATSVDTSLDEILPYIERPSQYLQFWMFPYGDESRGVNLSAQQKTTESYVYGVVEVEVLPASKAVSYHSMHKPSLLEWYLSPGSFSVNPRYVLGDDGCEQLYPANIATSEFRFFQIVRGDPIGDEHADVRAGLALEYRTSWLPLGHTLGQIIYSLPLAPGEIVKIAIINWQRKSTDSREEDLTVAEQLAHNTHRDRTISETVEAAMNEWQRGGSFMGGNSGGAGVSFGIPMIGVNAGNAHSFGGGYSTSSGDRNITASTTQQVSDAFAQVSSSLRELRSTIVVQSDQQENAKAETRVIANNNHSHALTMLYYEVLRHFKVVTEYRAARNALLVRYTAPSFDSFDEIWEYQLNVKPLLLDETLSPAFDAIEKYRCAKFAAERAPVPVQPRDWPISSLKATIKTGTNGGDGDVRIDIVLMNNTVINLLYPMSEDDIDKTKLDTPGNDFESNSTEIRDGLILRDYASVRWGDVKTIIVSYRALRNGPGSWSLAHLKLEAPTQHGPIILFDNNVAINLNPSEPNHPATHLNDYGDRDPARLPANSPYDIPTSEATQVAYDTLSDAEKCMIEKLRLHLQTNRYYYRRFIWMTEDPNRRAVRFSDIQIADRALLDLVENRPIDVYGDYVAFPSHHENGLKLNATNARVESLMTLPSRGVFGEAKLGHCNASEIIDNTRFWDWQQSPNPQQAPEIAPVDTGTRNVTPVLTPTGLPNSIVNIVNPTPAPDPSAMAGVLELLGKSNIFRDMSMSNQVTDLLKELSEDAVKYGEMANKARGILDAQGQGGSGSMSPAPANPGAGTSSSPSTGPQSASTQQQAESAELDNTEKKLEIAKKHLPPSQQAKVREKAEAELTAIERTIWVDLHTADEGMLLHVLEPADYDINQAYAGKLVFADGMAQIRTKVASGMLHMKFRAQVKSFPGRDYISKMPGFEAQAGGFYFEAAGFFTFGTADVINMKGILTLSQPPATVTVHVTASGSATVTGGIELAAGPLGKISGGVETELGGEAGTQIAYSVQQITGISLRQRAATG